jgi:hypothetical protein
MRRVLISAVALVLAACSVVAPEYRPTPTPTPTTAAVRTPDVQPVTYDVTPFEFRSSTATKTAIFFSNPNSFVLEWFMTVRLRAGDGTVLRDERIGSSGVPPDRADAKFQNWYFPIPPGDSWTVVRFETAFAKTDVLEFKIARSLIVIGEVSGLRIANQACAADSTLGVIGCDVTLETTATVPAFSKLHLVVVARSTASPRVALRALQWRPELLGAKKPWFSLAAGEKMRIEISDGYPTPLVPWEYDVFTHVYQYSSQ